MFEASQALDRLVQLQNANGGWGYGPGLYVHPEPTCYALLALNTQEGKYREAITKGRASLATHRSPEGAYRLEQGRPQAFWPTAIALFTNKVLAAPASELTQTTDLLLGVQGKSITSDPEFADLLDIDTQLIGWPWALNTFSWVEPTSWACLALRLCGQGEHPRVVEGIRTIFDRAFETGGANYGNRTVLGQLTTPFPGPSSLMLLALQGFDDEKRVQAGRTFLFDSVRESTDLEHLAWAILALSVYDDTTEAVQTLSARLEKIYQSQLDDGRPISVPRHAATLLALSTDKQNYFRLTGELRKAPSLDKPRPEIQEYQLPVAKKGLLGKVKAKFQNVMMSGLGAMRPLPEKSNVHIAEAKSYDIDLLAILKQQFDHFRSTVPLAGKKIVLKPNLVEYHADRPINTDARVIDAVISLCKAEGAAEIVVAEGPGHWRNSDYLVDASGLREVLKRQDVRFVDINYDEPVKQMNLGRCTGLEYLFLPRTITSADVLISLPKLKMHHWAGVTLSLKNLFGILPGQCYGWPKNELHWRGIPNSVVDIALTQTPQLAIVDGIWGMEGDGPIYGTGRFMGALIMSNDLLALDATCARMIGLPPERAPVLMLAAMKKLGRLSEAEIFQIGEPLDKFRAEWKWPPRIERLLLPIESKTA
ncbi:DUF362 domain-containing protein [Telmatocola sphagniphila]|uniref:DUF362 domain-containing protein n=1 Tax=Telmatocola sphagniphila TaxID=1123043 RepID=A0A8E6B6U0_9BACT|nr:DUF362 domain-containing protein [Telmatocola sphagniphila]QVL32791.1 DUF362 domain-containing protein [Telmatocola sphagniphila]